MNKKTCILYWCYGAGHATRIIEVAKELKREGENVSVAGGGQGKDFVTLNGFEQPDLTEIKLNNDEGIKKYLELTFLGLKQAFTRIIDIWKWIGREKPEVLITDDLAAAVIGRIKGAKVYRIEHLTPSMLEFPYNWFQKTWDKSFQIMGGEKIIVSTLFKEQKTDKELYNFVDPLAQKGEEKIGSQEIVLIPGTHGKGYEQIKEKLESNGYDVLLVGGDNWEPKESVIPFLRSANVVICSGFSSIADSVVSKTPCVVYPEIQGQKAVAKEIKEKQVRGVETAKSQKQVVEKTRKFLETDQPKPEFDNGFKQVVKAIKDKE